MAVQAANVIDVCMFWRVLDSAGLKFHCQKHIYWIGEQIVPLRKMVLAAPPLIPTNEL
jgi:hypothetical protein